MSILFSIIQSMRGGISQPTPPQTPPTSWAGKRSRFYGDSITAAIGDPAGINSGGYAFYLAQLRGGATTYTNFGVSGMHLQDLSPCASNMFNTASIAAYDAAQDVLCSFAFGVNDELHNRKAVSNPTTFKARLLVVIDAAIAQGWPLNKILIISPFWIKPTYYAGQVGTGSGCSADVDPSTEVIHASFVAKTAEAASQKGVLYVNVSTPMSVNPNRDSYVADGLHYNAAGYNYVAGLINVAIP